MRYYDGALPEATVLGFDDYADIAGRLRSILAGEADLVSMATDRIAEPGRVYRTAMAVMIRPNLAPLALVIVASVAAAHRASPSQVFERIAAYGVTAALGPAVVM